MSGSGGTANGSAQTETGDDVVELDGDSSQSDSEGAKKDGDSTKVTSRVVFTLKLASSGPYGPLLARSGYVGEGALVLQKHSL